MFVTGNAIALWQAQKETIITSDHWYWHKDSSGDSLRYIVTDKKIVL